jgi:ubiquitin-like-conjugating enzyme ATG10
MSSHGEYQQWPFLTQEEFELACAFFDQQYIQAKLGPTRRIFKIRHRRNATTGASYIEILRLINPTEEDDGLSMALGKLNSNGSPALGMAMEVDGECEDEDEVSAG